MILFFFKLYDTMILYYIVSYFLIITLCYIHINGNINVDIDVLYDVIIDIFDCIILPGNNFYCIVLICII